MLCVLRLQVSRDPSLCGGALYPLPSASLAPSWVGLRGLKKAKLGLPHSLAFRRLSSSSSFRGMHPTDGSAPLHPNLPSHTSSPASVQPHSFLPPSNTCCQSPGRSRVPGQGGAQDGLGRSSWTSRWGEFTIVGSLARCWVQSSHLGVLAGEGRKLREGSCCAYATSFMKASALLMSSLCKPETPHLLGRDLWGQR